MTKVKINITRYFEVIEAAEIKSDSQLAATTGISRRTIARVKSEHAIDRGKLLLLCRSIGADPEYLIGTSDRYPIFDEEGEHLVTPDYNEFSMRSELADHYDMMLKLLLFCGYSPEDVEHLKNGDLFVLNLKVLKTVQSFMNDVHSGEGISATVSADDFINHFKP